jgi:cyclic beta-1,2-glucan synthetase
MKVATRNVSDLFSRFRTEFTVDKTNKNYNYEEPIRSELYSSDQMDRHGGVVAGSHKLLTKKASDQLLKRLDDNERTLLDVRHLLVEGIRGGKAVTPGAEWFLDNFYLIEEQVIIARKHLPKGYSEGLPCLSEGISSGMPRVYDIVLEIISHSDGRVDVKSLRSFIAAYQTVTILTLGELWAIPIMLRLAVIENLRRVCGKIALDMVDHNLADLWADKMMTTVKDAPEDLILTIADMARSKPVLGSPFVAGFTRKLQGKGPALALPLSWMEQKLTALGISSNDLVSQENQKQAADQVSVRNCVGTLRFLGATDWRDFVEALSSVESVLRKDTAGTYPLMDFATRDRYRHVVESISKASELSETEVALAALSLSAADHVDEDQNTRVKHVGYYLIDKGLAQTERVAGAKYSLRLRLSRIFGRAPVFVYLFSILLLTMLPAAGMWRLALDQHILNGYVLTLLGILLISGMGQLAVSLVNWFATIWVKPTLLPRMDFSEGIPEECRTLVIIPTMISGKHYIEQLVEALEIRFLANRERHVHFGLLTDFVDAATDVKPEDDDLLELTRSRIADLNQRYSAPDEDIFFLFHRPRLWNGKEDKWMGYERKRGKLSALNAFLRGHDEGAFSLVEGDTTFLEQVRYVITLDSDTQLPREAVWKFVATMSHPLNRPIYNQQKRRVTDGYGILQPRLASSMPSKAVSLYLRMQGDLSGIDPYTRVSSDVYQDLFGEGSFIGKGIYEVDVFEQTLGHVFQENRILSHDLLEGCYTRSGLISDVLLYEENPSVYSDDVKRHHRWIRGDWQIGAWMLPFVTNNAGHLTNNKLSGLSRWKIFDNIRRSLLPLSLVLLLLLGWSALPFPWLWTLTVTCIILLPVLTAAGWQLVNKPKDLNFSSHFFEVGISVRDILLRFMFGIAVLPFEAYRYTDAVLRTNWRMIVSGKKLLEWTPSATISNHGDKGLWPVYLSMWISPFLAILVIVVLGYTNPWALLVASPMLMLWLFAPVLAWRLSVPEKEKSLGLTEDQVLFLHQTARKTWTYFEEFVTEAENWMPPDNFQQEPAPVIAHRTSPTNLGLNLLSNLTAWDFGYITTDELLSRCSNSMVTMGKLERYRGHFYNWYDTLTLEAMLPRYVSTVDSGNLIGHLLTLRQGLLSLADQVIFGTNTFEGIRTTARILLEYSDKLHVEVVERMMTVLDEADREMNSLSSIKRNLDRLVSLTEELDRHAGDKNVTRWSEKLSKQIKNEHNELTRVAPWIQIFPIPDEFIELSVLEENVSCAAIGNMPDVLSTHINDYVGNADSQEKEWLFNLRSLIVTGSELAKSKMILAERLAEQCEEMSTVDYEFLFDRSTSLLRIGYNADEQRKDDSFYDLLASEARLGIFAGIAQGKLPQESWFALGRLLTNSGGDPILLSWSGSMFEYLMPQLVMPAYENTLLYQTNKATVKRQIEYGAQRGIPWGISESAYNTVDASMNYQYRAFGVPGLGLKRGLEEDLVIAPYASMLALMVSPAKACLNLELLAKEGFEGEYGFYEAIDYTASRLPRGQENTILHSFMVHHQGMGFLSLSYLLLDKPMQQRFVSELRFQATLLLLQERIPRATLFYAHTADLVESKTTVIDSQIRIIPTADTALPEIQLLSNGRYHVMVSNAGGGYSRWRDIAVTRWREDATTDNTGIFCYIKDIGSGNFWSNTYQPTLRAAKNYQTVFSLGHAEFERHDHGIDTKTEIVISPEDDTEMRRLRISNKSLTVKILEITSYAEIVLARQASDEAHPAFSNLFVQTEIIQEYNAVMCTRRARSKEETPPWMFHMMDVHGTTAEMVSYETDRMRFVGRGKTLDYPQAMDDEFLSGSQGSVLDPITSIRRRITIQPNQTATVDLIYGVSESRTGCEHMIHKYRDRHLKKRAFELSWTHSQVLLRQINATEADAQLYDKLASSIIYANASLRGETAVIISNFRGQSGLWSHSVSGDLPIVLLHIYDPDSVELVRQMVQAHAYWRLKGLAVDLVIWNEDYGSYRQILQDQILGLISSEAGNNVQYSKPGSIFVKSADQISPEDRMLFESVARVIIHDNKGTLSEQVNRHIPEKIFAPVLPYKPVMMPLTEHENMTLPDNLLFNNGTGGFTADGKEYKILTDKNETTPAPWVNVIANPDFGTVVSESGSAYTWAINAHEYRLTPWSNDPVSDVGGEAFYLRDEESGSFWSPSPFPATGSTPYLTTHGFGYTRFEHAEEGILSEMKVSVDKDLPVKFVVIKIRNQSGRARRFSATGFLQMILGDVHAKTNMHIVSEQDVESGALLIRNRYNTPFAERVSFFHAEGANLSFTADRSEFIGRNRSLKDPQAMSRKKLSGRRGAGLDPCAALQVKFDIADQSEKEIVFLIGNAENTMAAQSIIRQFSDRNAVIASLEEVREYWNDVVETVQVVTPDESLNVLANGWLTYQTMACRIFARSGFYQSGGAFGFRDQLQDVLALLHSQPQMAREQILLGASKQFLEGDVQHWWHPPEGRGVRTRCSDDLLWLPYAVSRYVAATGDNSILSESVGFLESRPLHPGEDSLYDLPMTSGRRETLYNHCTRAIKHSLRFGEHGLPFIGSGDWNDGMDQVGNEGKGESVWLAFFLYDVLQRFTEVASIYGDSLFAFICKRESATLQTNIETHAWDGEWYKRAWFDDGLQLGSKDNVECRIDAIAQSWSVLSGAGDDKRKVTAMASLDQYLVKPDLKLIQLLDPPFNGEGPNPGYIQGYVPGVRENGGQYSHAAIWALMGFAALGERAKVYELFSMINPLSHSSSASDVSRYKVEPYVMAADVYANESHQGRGGWTWYTGSAGWMYQFITGSLLGMQLKTDKLIFTPCFPLEWPNVSITYRFGKSTYKITVFQLKGPYESWWKIDDEQGDGNQIVLTDDGKEHLVEVHISIAEYGAVVI